MPSAVHGVVSGMTGDETKTRPEDSNAGPARPAAPLRSVAESARPVAEVSRPSIADRWARRWLIVLGVLDCFAAVPLFAPAGFHEAVNRLTLPGVDSSGPLVSYLTRATCAIYVSHGLILLGIASDLTRYRPLAKLLGWIAVGHGLVLLWIDISAGLPGWWSALEGPGFVACGLILLGLLRAGQTSARSTD